MLRKVASLTSFLSLAVTLVTSVVLYIVPQGRVAYWADWRLLGLSKEQWGDVHIAVGTLFLLALLVHLWLNWKPLADCMKNRARRLVVMTRPMIVSLALTLFVAAGTLMGLPPMQQLLDLSASIKGDAVAVYGNPPYGHAEMSPLKKFCGFLGFDADEALAALKAAGYAETLTEETPIRDIARSKGVTPQRVYDDIRAALVSDPFAALPVSPPEGTGRMTLADLAATFGLPLDETVARLAAEGVAAEPNMTLKRIGQKFGLHPKEVYSAVRGE